MTPAIANIQEVIAYLEAILNNEPNMELAIKIQLLYDTIEQITPQPKYLIIESSINYETRD